MNQIVFAHPKFLYLLLLVPAMVAWYIFRQKDSKASLQISTLQSFAKAPVSIKVYLRHLLVALRVIVVALIIIVLARPQSTNTWKNITTEGIDIMLSIDVSGSMLARDFTPDRLEAAKEIGIKFISGRQTDRMGLVVFSGESFTLCPLTTDHASLINMFKDIKMGILEDGTAIGSGLAVATSRLKESTAISRVVILLTDGVNNRGEIAPLTAAEIAKSYGVRVYPVGIGSMGTAPYPVQTPFGVQYQEMEVKIDEEMLQQVADMTGGKYFRATNNKALEQVYAEIDKLERSKIDVVEHNKREERFRIFGFIALAMIALEFALRTTIFRSIP